MLGGLEGALISPKGHREPRENWVSQARLVEVAAVELSGWEGAYISFNCSLGSQHTLG